MSEEKKYWKRIKFKLESKDKWISTYWFSSNCDELPYDLQSFIVVLNRMVDSDEFHIKIERKCKK